MTYNNEETEFRRIDDIMMGRCGFHIEQSVREYGSGLPHFHCYIDDVESVDDDNP